MAPGWRGGDFVACCSQRFAASVHGKVLSGLGAEHKGPALGFLRVKEKPLVLRLAVISLAREQYLKLTNICSTARESAHRYIDSYMNRLKQLQGFNELQKAPYRGVFH